MFNLYLCASLGIGILLAGDLCPGVPVSFLIFSDFLGGVEGLGEWVAVCLGWQFVSGGSLGGLIVVGLWTIFFLFLGV